MADERSALSLFPQDVPAEADYDAVCAGIMASARGRWFLQEYARRNRHAEAELLAAAERLQDLAWTLRERGFDFWICDQIDAAAKVVVAASALQRDLPAPVDPPGSADAVADRGSDTIATGRAVVILPSPRDTSDPLAPLEAMSDEERIALFT
jgi:hypothetical protein